MDKTLKNNSQDKLEIIFNEIQKIAKLARESNGKLLRIDGIDLSDIGKTVVSITLVYRDCQMYPYQK